MLNKVQHDFVCHAYNTRCNEVGFHHKAIYLSSYTRAIAIERLVEKKKTTIGGVKHVEMCT